MKKLAILAALLGTASPAIAAETILAGNLIADTSEGPIGPATITVDDGRIVSVVKGINRPADGIVHDLSDKTVMPGLIDMHVHITGDPSGDYWKAATTPDSWGVIVGVKNAEKTLKAGFTTVRDLGPRGSDSAFVLRRGIAEGYVQGPRIIASGPSISIVGGHGDVNGFRPDVNELLDDGFNCTGAVECAEKVRLASQNGSDVIKITATGGVLSQQGRGLEAHFTDAEMKSIADTAHSLGLKVAAHAHGARGIEAAARAGIDTIDHGTYADERALRAMKANGSYFVPTLAAFEGVRQGMAEGRYTPVVNAKIREVMDQVGEPIRPALDMGVKVAFGTDAGVFPHGENAMEFRLLVNAGMTPQQALSSATLVAAEALGMENEIGRIAPGYSADIIAFDGDPYADVTVLEEVDWVMARGRAAN
ncbi:metal-dependent hydrolase family protein [Sphingomicrobium lutaoense]|uniref:Imidazolonepropionase-like amidohydrolase n=1 Tax=Sphingomicrobium lutaoense TaxID=515949 RepID=A0A839YY22_9SPHN|nr:amidohydrolase family protein [Sphingomicrobium lutaoense]MBB3763380.1 imidazolonepropionase-like amidohydrolase [Sphingomicrobium lutaoense]